jgi:hypothetical protein
VKRIVFEGEPFELGVDDRGELLGLRIGGTVQAHHDGRISIARVVGHVRLSSGTTLCIRSAKSPAASVLAWMAYVDPTLRAFILEGDAPNASDDGDIAALTARLFLRELRRSVSRHGVPRQYARTSSVSSAIRGRIDFPRLMDRAGDLSKVPCSTWERQPRSPAVRTLAAALEVVERDAVMRHASHSDLAFLRVAFADVSPFADPVVLAGKATLARNEAGFSSALALACLLLRRTLLGEGAREAGVGHLVNLEALFESAVVLALAHSELPFRAKVPVEYQQVFAPQKATTAMQMEMDAFAPTFADRGGVVVDAKYKRAISASNLQQVVTYCYVTGSAVAVLVVPAGFGAGPARYRFADGRGSDSIDVHVVELDTSGTSIEAWETNAAKLGASVRAIAATAVAA